MAPENNSEDVGGLPESFAEAYRDPQIDELIDELRVLHSIAHSLHEIREALYTHEYSVPEQIPPGPNEFPTVVFPQRISALGALVKAIEKLKPAPWYVRLSALFRVKRANSELHKMAVIHKQTEKERREHMQRLAEHASQLNAGRFKSRYL
jgi:hypothetical protein